jgi:hypothetical protein
VGSVSRLRRAFGRRIGGRGGQSCGETGNGIHEGWNHVVVEAVGVGIYRADPNDDDRDHALFGKIAAFTGGLVCAPVCILGRLLICSGRRRRAKSEEADEVEAVESIGLAVHFPRCGVALDSSRHSAVLERFEKALQGDVVASAEASSGRGRGRVVFHQASCGGDGCCREKTG